jgi:uncharacterized protein (DUF2252 family)
VNHHLTATTTALSHDDRVALGKRARVVVPRSSQATLSLHDTRGRDPVALLVKQGRARVQELLPLRYARMAESPFTFLRGAASVMAADLAATPSTGIQTQLCGDCHLVNFGLFGTPERQLVFDINDFDETFPGPWEWDLKRLVASIDVAGRDRGFSRVARGDCVRAATRAYREAMIALAAQRNLEVWYARMDAERVASFQRSLSARARAISRRSQEKAQSKDSLTAFKKLTEVVDGVLRIASRPPLIVPLRDFVGADRSASLLQRLGRVVERYIQSLDPPRQVLMRQYRLVDVAHKVVGIGSVGTRCWVALFIGADDDDPLLLQVKEANASVLQPHVDSARYEHQGQRVVIGQRLMQAQSDILLGWAKGEGLTGKPADYYLRQLHDWKGAYPIEEMSPSLMAIYGERCGWTLARAHARGGDRIAIASYLGANDAYDEAMVKLARAYADQTELDHKALVRAIRAGRVPASTGTRANVPKFDA